ncbi:MAG: hypothetical protein HFH89_10730 [Lachnospiraceae bacterium]|nr:hypothetical protein [Lachnospiraceae bacterium]
MALTKDADMLACLIYKEYLSKRKSGESKANAKHFKNDFYLTYKKISVWSPDDIDETVNELKRASFVKKYLDGSFVLLDDFIIYMENRFKNGFAEVTDFIAKFIP